VDKRGVKPRKEIGKTDKTPRLWGGRPRGREGKRMKEESVIRGKNSMDGEGRFVGTQPNVRKRRSWECRGDVTQPKRHAGFGKSTYNVRVGSKRKNDG